VREWGLKPGQLGPVFSASLVGILFGSALFGWIGDRYGRKIALISSNLLFGVFTFAAAYSANLDQLFWLRLLAGLGIGGVIPNIVAINTESAPRKYRATLALLAVGFVSVGGAIPGVVAATLVPAHGWQILFIIGGIVPIVLAVIGLFTLPESIKFMALHESQRAKSAGLSDLAARQRLGLRARHRTYRLDHRAAGRCLVRRPAGRAALHVVVAAIRARRRGLLRHLEAQ